MDISKLERITKDWPIKIQNLLLDTAFEQCEEQIVGLKRKKAEIRRNHDGKTFLNLSYVKQ
jgi:predicted kinase